jgi:glycosyltransferase involved in cell wall biosynthesis
VQRLDTISLAHDSFTQAGGAERVFDAIHEMFPVAPVYTLVVDKKFSEKLSSWKIRTTFLQSLYPLVPGLQYLLPLIPLALRLSPVRGQIILSSSSGFVRNLYAKKDAIHIDYCHTPTRFLWIDKNYALQELPWYLKPLYPFLVIFLAWMRKWDYAGAQRVSHFVANSKEVQARIKKYYNRDSVVIEPFVDTNFWHKTSEKGNYFLLAGRLHTHKNNEQVIELFNALGLPLHVVGSGRQEAYLRSIAKPNVQFLGRVSDQQLRDEYSGARAYIFPQFEDFGLMPLEAASCGTATIGLAKGGTLETVVPGSTGELFAEGDIEHLKKYVTSWDVSSYSYEKLRNHAERFSKNNFTSRLRAYLEEVTNV